MINNKETRNCDILVLNFEQFPCNVAWPYSNYIESAFGYTTNAEI